MRIRRTLLTLMMGSVLLVGCGSNTPIEKETRLAAETPTTETPTAQTPAAEASETKIKVLIAYFTRADNINVDPDVDAVSSASINSDGSDYKGNVETMAEYIQEITGGDTFSILTTELYPTEYRATTDLAKTEQNENARPELHSHVENMEEYDVIYLGYPNWWGGLPMPVYTFLEEYDFSGKTIIPFASHEGSGLGTGPSEIEDVCPDATILDGLDVRGSSVADSKADIENWIDGLNVE